MATKRTRSHSPARARTATPTNASDDTERIPLPMPSANGITPEQWLFNMEQWFERSGITDGRVKYALLATTQKPSSFATLQAEVRALPDHDPFEIARNHILRQRQQTPQDTEAVEENRTSTRQPCDRANRNETRASVSVTSPATTEVERTVIPRDDSEISQALQQMETMLLGKIRAITIDIAELQALYPTQRRRPPTPARAGQAESVRRSHTNAPTIEEPCWYHQTYGRQARLCRAPCSLRPA